MNYPKEFERWWQCFSTTSPSAKGSKYQAYEVWKSLKSKNELPTVDILIKGVFVHKNNDRYFRNKNQFVPSWQHGCRWLKNRCWEVQDEMDLERQNKIKARQREIQQQQQKYIDSYGAWVQQCDAATLIERCQVDPIIQCVTRKLRPDVLEKKDESKTT